MGPSELLIKNKLTQEQGNLKVRIYPIGTFFRAATQQNEYYQYTAFAQINDFPSGRPFITGGEKVIVPYVQSDTVHRAGLFRIDQDGASSSGGCDITVGYGKYQVDIMYDFGSGWEIIESFTMDWSDSDYPIHNYNNADIKVYVLDTNDIKIHYGGGNTEPYQNYSYNFHNLSLFNNEVRIWFQYTKFPNGSDTIISKNPNKNNFRTTDTLNNLFLGNWPVKGTDFLNPGAPSIHTTPGILNVNLEIQNNHYAKINTSIPFIIEDSAKLKLKFSNTYANNARLYVQNNAEFRIRPLGNLELDKYGNVILESGGKMYMEQNSNIIFQDHGEIIINSGGTLYNCGAIISNNSSVCIIIHNGGNYLIGPEYCIPSVTHTFDDGAFLVVNGGTLNIGDNSKIIFDGPTSFLKVNPNSSIKFGENASIEFKNGAYINANGGSFATSNPAKLWEGISLENSGNDSIVNCTFSNAKTALSFINDEQHKFTNRIIKNCTFSIPTGGDHKGIYGENNYSILVEGNRFNMPASPGGSPFYTGLYLKNVTPSSPPEAAGEEGASATPYSLNIVNNTFRNGSSGIVLANYTSNLLPYYIKGNRFDSLDAHAAMTNILGMNVTGTFKDNVLSSSLTPIGIHLIKGYPNLLNNIVNARDVALYLSGSSYVNLAPNIYNNQTYWSAGKNTLSSYLYDNIQLAAIGNAYTDYGRNKFTVSNDSAYHIYGWLDTNVLRYHSRDNCWYTSEAAKIYLRHPGATLPVLSTIYNRGIDCNSSPAPISWEVDNLGNGIFDSVLVSDDVSDSLPTEEEILIAQCE